MPKKKQVIEDAIEVAEEKAPVAEVKAAAKNVAVEMTPEQRDQFVDFMAKKEEEDILAKDAEILKGKKSKVRLTFRHNVNGNRYGPGMADVPTELVGMLQRMEDDRRHAEIKILTSSSKTFEVLQDGGKIEVPGGSL